MTDSFRHWLNGLDKKIYIKPVTIFLEKKLEAISNFKLDAGIIYKTIHIFIRLLLFDPKGCECRGGNTHEDILF